MGLCSASKHPVRHLSSWGTGLLVVFLFPLLRAFHLPTHFDWTRLIVTFWVLLATKSIFVAVLLYVLATSTRKSIRAVFTRVRCEKAYAIMVLAYMGFLCWWLTWAQAFLVTFDTVAIIELRQRLKPKGLGNAAEAVLPAALYLFCGLLLVSAHNDIILSVRYFAASDPALNSIDRWLLHGFSVSQLSHWALQSFPISFFYFLEFIYYGMFPVLGAALIVLALLYSKAHAFQFVQTILAAYYIALCLFLLWPSQGPYYLCPSHFLHFPPTLKTFAAQKGSLIGAQNLSNRVPLSRISFDYYIAFPCMHIVQPLIAMWFLRIWKRLLLVFSIYNVLLLLAILLLEWHYVIDVLAGFLVAALAIASTEGFRAFRPGLARGFVEIPNPDSVASS